MALNDYLLQNIIVIISNSAVFLVCRLHILLRLMFVVSSAMLHFSCTFAFDYFVASNTPTIIGSRHTGEVVMGGPHGEKLKGRR